MRHIYLALITGIAALIMMILNIFTQTLSSFISMVLFWVATIGWVIVDKKEGRKKNELKQKT